MEKLLKDFFPHAPNLGIYVDPHIPAKLLYNATTDYAPEMDPEKVVVLLDLTLLKNARDGALLGLDRMVFQCTDFERPHVVPYRDIVGVAAKVGFFACKLILSVNSGRATYEAAIDFSARGRKTLGYFQRFFEEVQLMPG